MQSQCKQTVVKSNNPQHGFHVTAGSRSNSATDVCLLPLLCIYPDKIPSIYVTGLIADLKCLTCEGKTRNALPGFRHLNITSYSLHLGPGMRAKSGASFQVNKTIWNLLTWPNKQAGGRAPASVCHAGILHCERLYRLNKIKTLKVTLALVCKREHIE